MTATPLPNSPSQTSQFKFSLVLPAASSHFFHDVYTSFLAPLLPLLIEKLSLSLTQAGSLTAILQIGSLLNPIIGFFADRVNLNFLVILTPAITATLMSLIGAADSYASLALLLLVTGVSVAAYHAPAPVMIARVSGRRLGLGMSLFMAFGELARTLGPLLAVWAVTTWQLEGLYRVMVLGWASSFILFLRLRNVSSRSDKPGQLSVLLPALRTFFIPLAVINLFRNFMLECLTTYLPTYMSAQGASLWMAGSALSILELAGVAGALVSGSLSDKLGRKPILLATTLIPVAVMLVFLNTQGWLVVPLLLGLGFTGLSSTPVMMAMVQETLPDNRSVANGLYMLFGFLLRPIATLGVGMLGDWMGIQQAYLWASLLSLLAVPAIFIIFRKPSPAQ
ncbi:MAG: MFS transporter [Anaerolineales bacterium]|nr:MFS transporter [Anaerolineales bacterium]